MSRIENKVQRLEQIEAILLAHPEGQSQSQLANRLGVHRSTILRNLADLSAPVFEEDGRYFIDRQAYFVNLKLNLHEALGIHLAGRMMSARLDRRNPHIAAALRKLGVAVKNLAPATGEHLCQSADCFDNASKVDDPLYLQILEKLTIAWAEQCEVELWYRKLDSSESKKYTFQPYFIEPGAIGQTIYVIGQIIPEYEIRTFKLERILRIDSTQNHYELPDAFDAGHLFDQAWGIWFTDQDPVEVKLKFSQRATQRVRETRWHPSEQVTICEDGSLLWKAFIAEPREMMPWIRGWGSEVEVLAPASIRKAIEEDIHNLFDIYLPKVEV